MYNHIIVGTKRKFPATSVDEEQQDTTRIAGSVNETENETQIDTTPATCAANSAGATDTIVSNDTNETTADRLANENFADENNEIDELTRGLLLAFGRLPKSSNQKSDLWKHIKQLGCMDPRRFENDNNQPSTYYCAHCGHLFSLPVNISIKKGLFYIRVQRH